MELFLSRSKQTRFLSLVAFIVTFNKSGNLLIFCILSTNLEYDDDGSQGEKPAYSLRRENKKKKKHTKSEVRGEN